jgi:hypothetical protein
MRVMMNFKDEEFVMVMSHEGVFTMVMVLEYNLKFVAHWKNQLEFGPIVYYDPLILVRYPDRLEAYHLEKQLGNYDMVANNTFEFEMDVTDLKDLCIWETFETMILVYPQKYKFGEHEYQLMRLKRIGGEDRELSSDFLPHNGVVSVALCQERSRFILLSNFEGFMRRFRLQGKKDLRAYQVDEWNLNLKGVTVVQENLTQRCLLVGTDEGEVFVLNWRKKRIMQRIKYAFPIHWISERHFDEKQLQFIITGPEVSKAELWPVHDTTYKLCYEQPRARMWEDNPYLRYEELEGQDEDPDSERGKEYQENRRFRKKIDIDRLPIKPPTLENILSYVYLFLLFKIVMNSF